MQTFRDDLLDVFFVSEDGAFGFVVSRADAADTLVVQAYRRPKHAGEDRIEHETAELIETRCGSFSPPDSPESDFGPARLGVVGLQTESNFDYPIFIMFGGPPPLGTEEGFAWVAIRPEVGIADIMAFPYYKGSFMDHMTGDDWLNDYDDPNQWYSPQRQYRPGVWSGPAARDRG